MMNISVDSVITVDNGEKFYLADETVQNSIKYYLANKLDENEEPTLKSTIFKEIVENGDVYLDEVEEEKEFNFISAIFLANYNNILEEEKEA